MALPKDSNLCNFACELDGMTVSYGGRYYTCRRHTQPRLRRRGPTATVRVLMRVLIVPVHECPGVSRDVGQAHHSAHHLRIHGRGDTVLDWLPQAGGRGVSQPDQSACSDAVEGVEVLLGGLWEGVEILLRGLDLRVTHALRNALGI